MEKQETKFKKGFASDNNSGVLPEVMEAIQRVNTSHCHAYGGDEITNEAEKIFRSHFGSSAQPFFVFSGTAANVLALTHLVKSYESVICAATSHLNVDECGAPERVSGLKLITIDTRNGKICPTDIEPLLVRTGDQHFRQPGVVSITQPTELGTVYTISEIRALVKFAKAKGMRFHIDGSRLSNAAAKLEVSFAAMTSELGVDAVSFGGTKNGLLLAEAVIFFDSAIARDFRYTRKQLMQLVSKMRFVSIQYATYLSNDLWLKTARHSHEMAKRLAKGVEGQPGIRITQPVESNAVFATLNASAIRKLKEHYFFYVWSENVFEEGVSKKDIQEVRWMTSFDTTADDVDRFVELALALTKTN